MQATVREPSAVANGTKTYPRVTAHAEGISSGVFTPRIWRFLSLLALMSSWLALELYGIFSPGLLDDVDSVYIESAREMLVRHDFVTPYLDGIRFLDKPPLMYW